MGIYVMFSGSTDVASENDSRPSLSSMYSSANIKTSVPEAMKTESDGIGLHVVPKVMEV